MVILLIFWIGSGVPLQKFYRFSESPGVLLVLPLGVGGSSSKILLIFQKYDEFDIVSEPKVLPPPPGVGESGDVIWGRFPDFGGFWKFSACFQMANDICPRFR